MIKINLLNSVTERQGGAVAVIDTKVASPASRLALMGVAVAVLLAALVGWDVIGTQMALADAQHKLEEQKQKAAELEAVMNEQKELEAKIANIDARINAIKELRASQAGPSAVLDAMTERISMVPGLYIESVEQKDGGLVIKGSSPDESQVTQFGRSLEFSAGLFTNLGIETVRAEVENKAVPAKVSTLTGETPKLSIVNFTIKCDYAPSKAPGADVKPTTAGAPATPAAPAPPVQVAKN